MVSLKIFIILLLLVSAIGGIALCCIDMEKSPSAFRRASVFAIILYAGLVAWMAWGILPHSFSLPQTTLIWITILSVAVFALLANVFKLVLKKIF